MQLDHLNTAQRAAVTAAPGPHLVIAGAGTGKTRTLVHRVAWLLDQGVDPRHVVLLTFTRRAAKEMLARAADIAGAPARRVRGGTFHSFAHQQLRRYADRVGLTREFTVLDRSDAADLLGLVRADLDLAGRGRRFPDKKALQRILSRHLNTGQPLLALLEEWFKPFVHDLAGIERVADAYVARKLSRNLVDYDDLLGLLAKLLTEHTDVRREISAGIRHLLVDEYQDTNRLQARIAALLAVGHGDVMVVGDDAQSIYAFRGATVRNILDFPKLYPACVVTRLEENYRSTPQVLALANGVLDGATEGYDKQLQSRIADGPPPTLVELGDEEAQAEHVVERVLALREEGVALTEMAALFRTGWHANLLEVALTRANIPYRRFGGLELLEAAHVKDVVSLLRAVCNPKDSLAWFRVLRWFDGIGGKTAQRLIGLIVDASPPKIDPSKAPKRAQVGVASLAALLDRCAGVRTDPTAVLEAVVEWYQPYLASLYEDASRRAPDLDALRVLAARAPDLEHLLAELALDPPVASEARADESEDEWLTLSTIHSAKGLEWQAVFLMQLVDGAFPSGFSLDDDAQFEEERRLLYVAVTRARRHLELLQPQWVQRRGFMAASPGCRLLDEIEALPDLVERSMPGRSVNLSPAPTLDLLEGEAERAARVLDFFS